MRTQGYITGTIIVNVQGMDWPTYLQAKNQRSLAMYFLSWAADYADPNDYCLPFFYSQGYYAQSCGLNDPHLDALVVNAAVEEDPSTRAGHYADITSYVHENAFYLWTSQATNFHVERRWVSGYLFNPMYCNMYYYPMSKVDSTITAPDPVRSVKAFTIMGQSEIEVTWAAPVHDGGSPVLAYDLYRSEMPGPSGREYIDSVPAYSLIYSDRNVEPGKVYYYCIAAVNEAGLSMLSAEVSAAQAPATPSSPQDLRAEAGNAQVSLTWSPPAIGGQGPITGYNVYRSLAIGGAYDLIGWTTTNSYTDAGLNNGMAYWYRVSAENSEGEGPPAGPVSATPDATPGAPQDVQCTPGMEHIVLSWNAPLGDDGASII